MTLDLPNHADQELTVTGTAWTAAGGAMVDAEGTKLPIYIADLEAWDDELEGARIEVTGVLRRRPSMIPESGPHSHGLGATWALENASWSAR